MVKFIKSIVQVILSTSLVFALVFGVRLFGGNNAVCVSAAENAQSEVEIIETEVPMIKYDIAGGGGDRWLIFCLSNHDYPENANLIDILSDYSELVKLGTFDNIIIRGELTVGGKAKKEATLSEIFKSNGKGDAIFINIWDYNYVGTLAVRTPAVTSISEIVINKGCCFPSYEYFKGSGVERKYVVNKTFVYTEDGDGKSEGQHAFTRKGSVNVDIQMEYGASVRIADDTSTSGLRFTTKIAKSSVEELNSVGYADISYGTIIVPTDYLTGGGIFSHDWLTKNYGEANTKNTFLDVASTGFFDMHGGGDDNYYYYHGSIVNLNESNYERSFSAIGYVKMVDSEGNVSYIYAPYDKSNSRSAAFVAEAAIKDRQQTAGGKYLYITENNDYSPYTNDERFKVGVYIPEKDESLVTQIQLDNLKNKDGSQTVEIGKELNGAYVQLIYSTNVNVLGEFTYTDGTKTAVEEFYLQAGTTEHKQYLDLFRYNGVGYGLNIDNLTMVSIKFTNVELEECTNGKVKLLGVYSEDRVIDTQNQEIYLTVEQGDGSNITVGAHLGLGGSLTYLAKSGVFEGIVNKSNSYNSGNVVLRTDTSEFKDSHKISFMGKTEAGYYGNATSSRAEDGAVNLINNTDAGRQIQQSWYAQVGGDKTQTNGNNGYNRAYCYTASSSGEYWPYNPVQAGDVVSNPSQIIDYEINLEKSYIYVKARAMDWAKGYNSKKPCENAVQGGVTTRSYMENYYRLNADGTLVVNNTFVDWNGFTDMQLCDWAPTELPAFYAVHTLNYYVTNIDGDGSWTDAIEYNNGLDAWTTNPYKQYSNKILGKTKVEDWFAWANGNSGNSFALGVYIPNVDTYTSGRTKNSIGYSTSQNKDSNECVLLSKNLMSNMQPIKYTYQSTYVSNTSYTAPGVSYRMEEYKQIEYSYVICLGTVDNIRSTFNAIKQNGTITNAGSNYEKIGLDAWGRSDKKWTW